MHKYQKLIGQTLPQVKFVTKWSKMGERVMLEVPVDYREEVKALGRKQLKVTISTEL